LNVTAVLASRSSVEEVYKLASGILNLGLMNLYIVVFKLIFPSS